MNSKYTRLRLACYTSGISMSVVSSLSPILFLTFRSAYGISYSLLGLLVLINFVTQLGVDLVFSFFSHKFNIAKTVKLMPVICLVGLIVYGVWPWIFPNAVYAGLAVGTCVFSAASGLAEVLVSPVIASIPSDDPDREMSKLHSMFAWGVVGVVLVSTLFLFVFGSGSWQWLALLLAIVPLVSAVLYAGADIPALATPERASGAVHLLSNKGVWLCVAAIFCGGAAECTMSQWSSSYLELALGIPKVWGDIFGTALFAMTLGMGRTLYAKSGRNITKVLLAGISGAAVCYFVAAVSPIPQLGLVACVLTGLCTSMLWPGTLVVATERFPAGGVFMYALMAAGGDLGASVVPQLVGIMTDAAIAMPSVAELASEAGMGAEQLGMKLGMLVGMIAPLCAIPIFARLHRKG